MSTLYSPVPNFMFYRNFCDRAEGTTCQKSLFGILKPSNVKISRKIEGPNVLQLPYLPVNLRAMSLFGFNEGIINLQIKYLV